MITNFCSEKLGLVKQTSDGMTDDGTAMQRYKVTGLRNGQLVVVERRKWPDDHATADDTIRRSLLDSESRRHERHRIERVVCHSGGADGERLR